MKKVLKTFALLTIILSFFNPTHIFASKNCKEGLSLPEKIQEFSQLVNLIKSSYGPLNYKKDNFGIDIDYLKAKYLAKLAFAKSNAEFYYLLVQFVAEYKDSHFALIVPTDHEASIPIHTDYIEDKIIVTHADKEKLPEDLKDVEVGDEVVSFNGKSVMREINFLKSYLGQGFDLTATRKASFLLFHRVGKRVPVPNKDDKVKITIKKQDSEELIAGDIKWVFKGTPLDEYDPASKILSGEEDYEKSLKNGKTSYGILKLNDEIAPVFESNNKKGYENYLCNPGTRVEIPDSATMIMKKPFVAYYHPTEKGNVGYLRIPHYYPINEQTGELDTEKWFKNYEYAVQVLEENTVGLIIDQDHNCGGSVELLERMLGLFIREPYQPMIFSLMASKESYFDFSEWQNETYENTIEYSYVEKVKETIKKHWLAGDFLTPKTSFWGGQNLYPQNVGYTKPIIVLIDEMSGSGGDAFPAMMQGNNRATLLGTRTMGAGGHVTKEPDLNYSRLQINMTKSLFYHPNGTPIENNGASPDIPYSPTINDVKNKFKDYQEFYLEELMKLI